MMRAMSGLAAFLAIMIATLMELCVSVFVISCERRKVDKRAGKTVMVACRLKGIAEP